MFDAIKFLDHLKLQLRNVGVDLTPRSAPLARVERMTANPRECYLLEFYGHTPDYPKVGDHQPAYKVKAYIYPQAREFHLQMHDGVSDWNRVLWPNCQNRTLAEHVIITHGVVGYDMQEWKVIQE